MWNLLSEGVPIMALFIQSWVYPFIYVYHKPNWSSKLSDIYTGTSLLKNTIDPHDYSADIWSSDQLFCLPLSKTDEFTQFLVSIGFQPI